MPGGLNVQSGRHDGRLVDALGAMEAKRPSFGPLRGPGVLKRYVFTMAVRSGSHSALTGNTQGQPGFGSGVTSKSEPDAGSPVVAERGLAFDGRKRAMGRMGQADQAAPQRAGL